MGEESRPDAIQASQVPRVQVLPDEGRPCPHGQVLQAHIGSRESDGSCTWCCRPETSQSREHLFKSCPAWREQQKVLWEEVRKQTMRDRDRFRCGPLRGRPLLQGGATVSGGKSAPKERPTEKDSDASAVSSWLCIGT